MRNVIGNMDLRRLDPVGDCGYNQCSIQSKSVQLQFHVL